MSTKKYETDDQVITTVTPATSDDTDDAKLLAELGYKDEFRRQFSLWTTIAFSFSIMGVIASVSSTLGFMLVSGGHVGMVFGWIIPCFFVMFVALALAELTSSMPTSAGLYYFSAKLAPPRWAPLASWITAWANITGQVSLVCSIDFTCAQMIVSAVSVAKPALALGAGPTYGIFVALIASHCIVCSIGTRLLARLNIFYVLINVGTTVAVIVALLLVSGENKVSTRVAFTAFENHTGWQNNAWSFILSFTAPMWTLTGYDSAAHISEEVSGAAKAAPLAILIGTAGTAILGWITLISVSFSTVSVSDLLDSSLPLPMAQLFLNVLGKPGMLVIWSFIIVVQYCTGAAQGVDASRVVFAFARDDALPGSRWWKQMHPRTQTPVNAVLFVMLASSICGIVGFSAAALTSLAGASVIGLYSSYAIPILLRITSGRSRFVAGPFNLGRWAIPIGSIATAWVSFIVVTLNFPPNQRVSGEDMNYSIAIIAVVLIFASGSWLLSARHWFTGPVRNVGIEQQSSISEKSA